jgi:hypothetical protein
MKVLKVIVDEIPKRCFECPFVLIGGGHNDAYCFALSTIGNTSDDTIWIPCANNVRRSDCPLTLEDK